MRSWGHWSPIMGSMSLQEEDRACSLLLPPYEDTVRSSCLHLGWGLAKASIFFNILCYTAFQFRDASNRQRETLLSPRNSQQYQTALVIMSTGHHNELRTTLFYRTLLHTKVYCSTTTWSHLFWAKHSYFLKYLKYYAYFHFKHRIVCFFKWEVQS